MAFEFRLSDTSPRVGQTALSPSAVNPGGVPPVSTYTPESIGVAQGVNVAQTPFSQRPKFAQAENIQGLPARQDPPGPGISTTSVRGGRGSVGNPIGNAIEGVGNRLAGALRNRPASARQAAIDFGGFEFPTRGLLPPTPSFSADVTSTPIPAGQFNVAPAFTATNLKDGGFIRKRT